MKVELKTDLLNRLAEKLKPYNFNFVKAKDCFVRKNGKVKEIYQISFHNKNSGYGVCLGLGIRLEEVEKIYHQVCEVEKQFQPHTLTFSNALREWEKPDQVHYEYFLMSLNDIDNLVNTFFEVFIKIVLPFFEKNANLKAIDQLLNNPNKRLYKPIYLTYYKGLIVAKLVNNDNYKQFIEKYREQLKEIGEFYLEDFDKLVKFIS